MNRPQMAKVRRTSACNIDAIPWFWWLMTSSPPWNSCIAAKQRHESGVSPVPRSLMLLPRTHCTVQNKKHTHTKVQFLIYRTLLTRLFLNMSMTGTTHNHSLYTPHIPCAQYHTLFTISMTNSIDSFVCIIFFSLFAIPSLFFNQKTERKKMGNNRE